MNLNTEKTNKNAAICQASTGDLYVRRVRRIAKTKDKIATSLKRKYSHYENSEPSGASADLNRMQGEGYNNDTTAMSMDCDNQSIMENIALSCRKEENNQGDEEMEICTVDNEELHAQTSFILKYPFWYAYDTRSGTFQRRDGEILDVAMQSASLINLEKGHHQF